MSDLGYGINHRLLDGANIAKGFWSEFKDFLFKGSIVEVAVGMIIAAAFGAVVNSFIDDILSPILGLIASKNLNNAYIPIKCPDNSTVSCSDIFMVTKMYPTLESAHAVGIVTWNYGRFVQELINFIIKSSILYVIINGFAAASSLRKREKAATEKECVYCCSKIPINASKCFACGSVIDKLALEGIHID